MTEAEALLKIREYLLNTIAQSADEIADIDAQISILKSKEHEHDLIRAAEAASHD